MPRKSKDRARAIAAVALDLFAERDFSTVTLKDIARRAGINPALVYYYFEDKEDLFRFSIESAIFAALEAEGGDLALRCGRGRIPNRVSVQLFEELCYPIASPALAERIGRGLPERLLDHPLIHDSDASAWRAWFASQNIDYRPRPQDRRFEDYNLVLDAAAHGLGIALARPPMIEDSHHRNRFVEADARRVKNPVSYWLDRPIRKPRPAAIALARRIMAEAGVAPDAVESFVSAQT